MLKPNIIKTYSRRQPLTFFNPTTALVAKYKNPDNNARVRESRLNDKTLIVDDLNDTFDKIATGVIVSSTEVEANYNAHDKSDQNSEEIFKIPSKILKKGKRPKEKDPEKLKSSQVSDSLRKRKNIVQTTVNVNSQMKKKKMKKIEKQKKERQKFKQEEKYSLRKCTISLKRCDREIDMEKSGINIANISQDDNSFNRKSYNSDSLFRNIEEYKEMSKMMHLKVTDYFPTSTPREHKLRKIVDMQNISPIILHKENKKANEEHNDLSSEIILEGGSDKKFNLRESNIDSDIKFLSKENGVMKSATGIKIIKDEYISNRFELNNFKHTLNDSKTEMIKLSSKNDLSNTTKNPISYERNNVLQQNSPLKLNIDNQDVMKTPIAKDNLKYKIECGDSPLLFEDTEENLSTKVDISKSYSQDSIPNLSKSKSAIEIGNNTNKIVNGRSRSLETSKNESSFYPHEWSNEYDSSYEYFSQKKYSIDKELDVKDYSNSENISEKFGVTETHISKNNASIPSSDNSLEKKNNSKDIEYSKQISSNNLSHTKINSLKSYNDVNNIPNAAFNKDNVNDDIMSNVQTLATSEKNINRSEKNNSSLQISHEINLSPVILKNNENRQMPNSNETSEIDLFDTQNENNLNSDNNQIDKSIKHDLGTAVQKENIKNTEKDNKLNDKELQVQLYKIDNQLVTKESLTSNHLKRKRIDESESSREKNKLFKSQSDELDFTQNSSILSSRNARNKTIQNSQFDIPKEENEEESHDNNISNISAAENVCIPLRNEKLHIEDNIEVEGNGVENFKNQTKEVKVNKGKTVFNSQNKNIKINSSNLARGAVSKIKTKKSTLKKKKQILNSVLEENNENKNKENDLDKSSNSIFKSLNKSLNKMKEAFKLKELCILVTKMDIQNIEKMSSTLSKRNTKENNEIIKLGQSNKSTYIKNKERNIENNENKINSIERQQNSLESNLSIEFVKHMSQNQNINLEAQEEIIKPLNSEKLISHFSKLNNSVAITMRRNVHKRSDRPLAAIAEYEIEQLSNIIDEEEELSETVNVSSIDNYNGDEKSEEHNHNKSIKNNSTHYPIFLKPGKFWSRSLSIINNFHSGQNLEELAVGRGQNWRHSVQSILNMQVEGTVPNNSRRMDNVSNLPDTLHEKKSNKFSTVSNTSPPRISRRFSIRIIPSDTRLTLADGFMESERISSISSKARKTSVARKTSLRIQKDTIIESEEDLIKSAETIILKHCKQTSYLPFHTCFSDSYIDHCRKIGEGVYGEVFLYENEIEKSVLKIIPIEGDELVNCEPQKKFHEILSEIIISEELHKLKFESTYKTNGFVDINRIMCVIGKYPKKLIDLWKKYDQEKKSENDCPSMFNDQQLYIILELAHGGQDLEAYSFQNASESLSIFLQTAFSLAVAEQSLEFEHRDLHWGNILISKTEDTNSSYKLNNEEIKLSTKGVKVSIIDFTLSRMSYQGCKIFNDLAADPTLFTAQGEYQFDIYRMMKNSVNNDWQQFNPVTNVFWLDYTLDKMITGARYKRKTTKVHKNAIEQMKQLRKEILNYKSAFDFVKNCEILIGIINSDKKCT